MSRTKELGELLRIAGYAMKASLLHDGFDGREGQAVWEITFSRNGREHTFNYHSPLVARYFPRGTPLDFHHIRTPVSVAQLELNRQSKPMKPTYAGCMYALLCNARSARKTFDGYCADYGYSTGNLRVIAAYKDCVDQLQGLDGLGADYDELNRLFEDY